MSDEVKRVIVETSETAVVDAATGVGSRVTSGLSKRTLLSALLGTSIGFGLGVAVHALWQTVSAAYARRSNATQLEKVMAELTILKSEFSEVRHLLYNTTRRTKPEDDQDGEAVPFYLSDDEDEFFDIFSEDMDSGPTSFYSATSHLSSKQSRLRLGPPVPVEVMEELDQLADLALGHFHLVSSTPKVSAGGDEISFGSQAYARCMVYNNTYRRSPAFLWRLARAIYLVMDEANGEEDTSATLGDPECQSDVTSSSSRLYDPHNLNDLAYESISRRQFVETGLGVARRALYLAKYAESRGENGTLDAKSWADIYKWLAVMVGLASDFVGMQQRIAYGCEFKDLIDKSIEYNSEDAFSHFLRGRWSYHVYNLSWVERQFAARLFATPPTATIEEAVKDFEEVERIQPSFYAANQLYLAKCYISRSDYRGAAIWLHKAKQLLDQNRTPPPHLDTNEVQTEISSLVTKYSGYF
ncbi:Regulator of microtubule dynamics protein 3 [Paragonimus westermani]|uniref:Regulator of microtubule dynamics protein 3 n=1 Tax=Paragonimus westermani TaxID=34504 RepID=A0A8T0D1P9_9TREM|nr:Regulator of microtubule dynamics protein 3 [Paragonimus westermani]